MAKAIQDADGKIRMLDATGIPVALDQSEVRGAIQAGYQLETADQAQARVEKEQYGGLGQQALTVAEGAGRGLTLGLSDAALVGALGDDYAAAAEARRRINPISATIGEVGGAVGGAFATGGGGLLARGAALTPAGLAARAGTLADDVVLRALGYQGAGTVARIGARAAALGTAGAAEGALQGLGESISNAALGGTEWTAEKALSGMETGALYGLGGGAALGALSSSLGAAGKYAANRMLEGKTLREAAQEFGEKRAVKAVVGNDQRVYNEITSYGTKPQELQRLGKRLVDEKIPLDNVDAARDALKAKQAEAFERLDGVMKEMDAAGVKVDTKAILENLDGQISKLRDSDLGNYKAVARRVEKLTEPFRKRVMSEGVMAVSPDGVARAVPRDQEISKIWDLRKRVDGLISDFQAQKKTPQAQALMDLRSTLEDSIGATLGEADPSLVARWDSAKQDYGDFTKLNKAARKEAVRQQKNRWTSPSDYGTGGLFGLGALQTLIASGGAALPSLAASSLVGVGASAAHKLIRERGSGAVAQLADAIAKTNLRTDGVARVLTGLRAASRVPVRAYAGAAVQEKYEGIQEQLNKYEEDPIGVLSKVGERLGGVAREQPEVVTAMTGIVAGDMAYLRSQSPVPQTRAGASLTPQAAKPLVPAIEQPSLVRKAEALADPPSVAEALARGEIDWDGLEALKARRPEQFQELRQAVIKYASARGSELPYHQRIALSLAFDFTGDKSLTPGALSSIQATGQAAENAAPQGSGMSAASAAQVSAQIDENTMTPNQAALSAGGV